MNERHRDKARAAGRWGLVRVELSRRARARSALILLTMIAAAGAVFLRNPRSYGMGVLCPTRRYFGFYCPGCGSTRAAHDLLHGQFGSAFANNPAGVGLGTPVVVWLVAMLLLGATRGYAWRIRTPATVGWWVTILLVLYMAARNIPIKSLDCLRPPQYSVNPESSEIASTETSPGP